MRSNCSEIKITRFSLIAAMLFVFLFCPKQAASQSKGDVFITIAKYIQKGDTEKLSIWFAQDLEIEILGDQVRCSRTQAKFIVKEFFAAHQPKKFDILHKSGNPSMRYAIGQLQGSSGEAYRIIMLVRNLESGQVIVRLRIEKE